jgi:hypothetical protein
MEKHHHHTVIAVVAIVAVVVIGYFVYKNNVPPAIVVPAFNPATGTGNFTCGAASGTIAPGQSFNCGYGYTLTFVAGNTSGTITAQVSKNGTVTKTSTITTTGTF